MTFPITPLSDIIVVEQKVENTTASGIILTGSKASEYPCGRVVAVGPGRVYTSFLDASGKHVSGQFVPMSVKVGDWAVFGKYQSGGEPIEVEGKKYLLFREGDLIGVSTEEIAVKALSVE